MPRIKSVYISTAMMLHMAATVAAVWALGHGAPALAWAGALLAAAALPLRLGAFFMLPRARTSANLPGLAALSGLGALLAVVGTTLASPESGQPAARALVIGLAGCASTLVYIFWYSRLGRTRNPTLDVGQPLPSFGLQDLDGRPVESRAYLGAPAVFLFYRGNWCPLCMAQVRELAQQYRELSQRGARVVLVSPQPQEHTRQLARRFDVSFDFLVDADGRAARQLGLLHAAGLPAGMQMFGYASDTVLPTVLITDAGGRIVFSDQSDNYRVRPTPATFLAALDAARA